MKILNDGTEIIDRVYYYVLDFDNQEKTECQQTYIQKNFEKDSVRSLTQKEFWEYFSYACLKDRENY